MEALQEECCSKFSSAKFVPAIHFFLINANFRQLLDKLRLGDSFTRSMRLLRSRPELPTKRWQQQELRRLSER
jgi:hypothetical protein